jgi:molybdopterin-containing oxidoreductase family iron-sulfur binding subunit
MVLDYSTAASILSRSKPAGFELVCIPKQVWETVNRLITWLQEFPDPITRVSWDNYVTVSNADAKLLKCLTKLLLTVV